MVGTGVGTNKVRVGVGIGVEVGVGMGVAVGVNVGDIITVRCAGTRSKVGEPLVLGWQAQRLITAIRVSKSSLSHFIGIPLRRYMVIKTNLHRGDIFSSV